MERKIVVEGKFEGSRSSFRYDKSKNCKVNYIDSFLKRIKKKIKSSK